METSSKKRKYHKTPYGLSNQGATCYLNSVLQLLFMTPDFHERLEPNLKTDQVLKTLFDNLKQRPCETKAITKHFQIEDVHKQHDAAEYLELILSETGQPASELFRGELSYSTKCRQNHTINEETNAFWTLPLPLKDQNSGVFSVEGGLRRIFMKKSYIGDNKVFCEDCDGNTEAERTCEMNAAPQVLILLLKRFAFDHNTGSHVKSNCTVEFPSTLKLKGKSYDLYGIVDHRGSLRGGHYTALLSDVGQTCPFLHNSSKGSLLLFDWFKFNDDHVQQEEKPTEPCQSDTAYLLAYRDQTKPPSPPPPPIINGKEQEEIEPREDQCTIPIPGTAQSANTCASWQRNVILIFCLLAVIILVLGLSLGLTRT